MFLSSPSKYNCRLSCTGGNFRDLGEWMEAFVIKSDLSCVIDQKCRNKAS